MRFHADLFFALSIVLSVLCGTQVLQGQTCGTIETYATIPVQANDENPTAIHVTGTWCVYVQNLQAIASVEGRVISVDILVTSGLMQVLTPWSTAPSAGVLSKGSYKVDVRLRNAATGQVMDEKSFRFVVKKLKE